jgi:hypothetical protein
MQADAARLVQQGLSKERRTELITSRCVVWQQLIDKLLLAAACATHHGSN